MWSQLVGPIVTGLVAVLGIYLTQFLAESYRRFRDGSALAAGLAGELSAYLSQRDRLEILLNTIIALTAKGRRDEFVFREVKESGNAFFDASVARLGLLGPKLVTEVTHVYLQIDILGLMVSALSREGQTLQQSEWVLRCHEAMTLIGEVSTRGEKLVQMLTARANARFAPFGHA